MTEKCSINYIYWSQTQRVFKNFESSRAGPCAEW